jgi:hypothetical protein
MMVLQAPFLSFTACRVLAREYKSCLLLLQMAANMMKNMSGEQLQGMMRMQRDMLKSNPELYEQIKASNPMMAQMTREQVSDRVVGLPDILNPVFPIPFSLVLGRYIVTLDKLCQGKP